MMYCIFFSYYLPIAVSIVVDMLWCYQFCLI